VNTRTRVNRVASQPITSAGGIRANIFQGEMCGLAEAILAVPRPA